MIRAGQTVPMRWSCNLKQASGSGLFGTLDRRPQTSDWRVCEGTRQIEKMIAITRYKDSDLTGTRRLW